eukprot:2759499-Alexandrium_andersonii.AAC.1
MPRGGLRLRTVSPRRRWSAAARGPREQLVGAYRRGCSRSFGPIARRFGRGHLGPWLGRLLVRSGPAPG